MDEPVLLITAVGGQLRDARFHYSPDEVQTGVAGMDRADMGLFPNPADGVVWLRVPAGNAGEVNVLDAQGRRVISSQRIPAAGDVALDVSGLAPGRYQVLVQGAQQRSLPLIVQP